MMNVFEKIISQIKAELESSEKFMREYDDGIAQKAYYSGMAHILYIIQKEVKEHNNGWIACSEKDPNVAGNYLITDWKGDIRVERYCGSSWFAGFGYVIAWQNLPQPYKERDTNGN